MNKWDERYLGEAYAFGTEPNDFLLETQAYLPTTGRALDLATGEGRNGIFLAQCGLNTLGVDLSAVGLAKAQKLAAQKGVPFATELIDISEMPFPTNHYDVISSVFCHFSEPQRSQIYQRVVNSLTPNGLFIGVFYHPEQISFGTGGPSDPNMLGTLEEMKTAFTGLEWVIAEHIQREVYEGERHRGMSSLVRLLGRKP